jgi:hypothetical protein
MPVRRRRGGGAAPLHHHPSNRVLPFLPLLSRLPLEPAANPSAVYLYSTRHTARFPAKRKYPFPPSRPVHRTPLTPSHPHTPSRRTPSTSTYTDPCHTKYCMSQAATAAPRACDPPSARSISQATPTPTVARPSFDRVTASFPHTMTCSRSAAHPPRLRVGAPSDLLLADLWLTIRSGGGPGVLRRGRGSGRDWLPGGMQVVSMSLFSSLSFVLWPLLSASYQPTLLYI